MSEAAPQPFPAPVPEALIGRVDTLGRLKEVRHREAETGERYALRRIISSADMIGDPNSVFTNVEDNDRWTDQGILGIGDYIALDGLGYAPDRVVGLLGRDKDQTQPAIEVRVGNEHLQVKRYGDGLTVKFAMDSQSPVDAFEEVKPVAIRQKVVDRYMQSPAHVAMHELADRASGNNQAGELSTRDFDLEADRLGSLNLLSSLGLTWSQFSPDMLSVHTSVEEILAASSVEKFGVSKIEDNPQELIVRTEPHGIARTVTVDRLHKTARVSFAGDRAYWYQERANQVQVQSEAFLETKCAEEFLGALDAAGLMPHPRYQNEMIRIGDAERGGAVYTQISREIAKWVNRDQRRQLSNLFVRFDTRTHAKGKSEYGNFFESEGIQRDLEYERTDEETEAEEAAIKQRLLAIDESAFSEPTKLLFRLAKQSILKNADRSGISELPVTKSDIRVGDGACFDVAAYYIGAAGSGWQNKLKSVTVNGVNILEKTHGSHTFMLQEPAVLNGVELPKGTLMQQGDDGGWAMLRLTPFCFDDPKDQLATGSELTKAYENEKEAITRIGGVSLGNIVSAVK